MVQVVEQDQMLMVEQVEPTLEAVVEEVLGVILWVVLVDQVLLLLDKVIPKHHLIIIT